MTTPISQTIPCHNPDNLTAEQVGEGWRLCLKEERATIPHQFWARASLEWIDGALSPCRFIDIARPHTYRTREPLPEKFWRRFQTSIAKEWIWDGIRGHWGDGEPSVFDLAYVEYKAADPALHLWTELPAEVPVETQEPDWFSDSYQAELFIKWRAVKGDMEMELWFNDNWEPINLGTWSPHSIYRERIKPPEPKRVTLFNTKISLNRGSDGKIEFRNGDGKPTSIGYFHEKDAEIIANFIKEAK